MLERVGVDVKYDLMAIAAVHGLAAVGHEAEQRSLIRCIVA
jgi:hypothetical protein